MATVFSKIAIVGSGAIGCYYGGRLARAGENVHFLMRGDLEAVRSKGLTIRLPHERFTVSVNAYARSEQIGACDLVIVGLKTTSNDQLLQLVRPLLRTGTAILTLQNGLGGDELLADLFGPERVLGGLCFIGVNRIAAAEIVCVEPGSVSFGEFAGGKSERLLALAALFDRAGLRCQTSSNLVLLRWRKLVWNVPFNGLSIAAGAVTTNQILQSPLLESLVRELMTEIIEAAAKLGHEIPLSFIDEQIEATHKIGAYRPSSLVDYEAGREVEVEAIWGEPLRRAQQTGASVVRLEMLYALLKNLSETPPQRRFLTSRDALAAQTR